MPPDGAARVRARQPVDGGGHRSGKMRRSGQRVMSPSESSAARRNVLAGTVGRVLEWYDFALSRYPAPIIGTL